jgi:hypothetical protein
MESVMSYKNDAKEVAQFFSLFGFGVWGIVLVLLPLIGGLGYISYLAYAFYAPKYEQVRYDTFKESQTYNDGMLRDLQNIQMEYLKANDEQKSALKAIALHRFSVYPEDKLPADLRNFYDSLKKGY